MCRSVLINTHVKCQQTYAASTSCLPEVCGWMNWIYIQINIISKHLIRPQKQFVSWALSTWTTGQHKYFKLFYVELLKYQDHQRQWHQFPLLFSDEGRFKMRSFIFGQALNFNLRLSCLVPGVCVTRRVDNLVPKKVESCILCFPKKHGKITMGDNNIIEQISWTQYTRPVYLLSKKTLLWWCDDLLSWISNHDDRNSAFVRVIYLDICLILSMFGVWCSENRCLNVSELFTTHLDGG